MSLFGSLFKTTRDVDELPAISSSIKQYFSFEYNHHHWIDGSATEHKITGDISLGLNFYGNQLERWSIRMNQIKFDWSMNSIPEFYFCFYAFQSIECFIDNKGNLVGDFDVLGQSDFIKWIKQEIHQHVEDKERANSIKELAEDVFRNPAYLKASLSSHPIIAMLIQLKLLLDQHNARKLDDQATHPYAKKSYFSKELDLPLKCRWFKKGISQELQILYSRVGGIDEDVLDSGLFRETMINLSGDVFVTDELHIDFNESFILQNKSHLDITSLDYAEAKLETILAEAWYKNEEIVIKRKEVSNG